MSAGWARQARGAGESGRVGERAGQSGFWSWVRAGTARGLGRVGGERAGGSERAGGGSERPWGSRSGGGRPEAGARAPGGDGRKQGRGPPGGDGARKRTWPGPAA